MAAEHPQRRPASRHLSAGQAAALPAVLTPTAARIAGLARLIMGFLFLWAVFDKTFGWGYSTPSAQAWVNGGSPTKGFLSRVASGPMQSTFNSWAGAAWADWLFMLGLLGIGLALAAGVAMRLAAASGAVMLALLWIAEWPPARHHSDGSPSMSTNPVIDDHVVYAVLLILLAALNAGRTWGLGRVWAILPVVRNHAWLR
jgi:thiosulfate dehydrogenase [quinone] large subunit